MTEIRAWDRKRDGEVLYNCTDRFQELINLPTALHAFLDMEAPAISADYTSRIEKVLRDLVSEEGTEDTRIQLPAAIKPWAELTSLQRQILEYAAALLGVGSASPEDEFSVSREISWRADLYPVFYLYKALVEISERESALGLLRKFVDQQMKSQTPPMLDLPDPGRWWDELEAPSEVTEGIAARFGRGKIAFRVDGCILHEVMQPLGDPELADIVCCYGDKSGFEALNPNLVFTRTMTLMVGPYCDTCMHDKRHSKDPSHPDHSFFRGLKPAT